MFPPGRARLVDKPAANGSDLIMTMGIVSRFLCSAGCCCAVTMMSTLRPTSSSASAGSRSNFSSADRYSMAMFFPST